MSKLSKAEYFELFLRDDVSDKDILQYSTVAKGEGGFEWTLEPDIEKVDITREELSQESIGQVVNSLARSRRARKFRKRLREGNNLPILVSEGDSWFQFPFLISEVIDQLQNDYLIWSVGAAGDTASNMVFGELRRGKTEYLAALKSQKENVRGFLFSGAGNDIIGENPDTGNSSLYGIIKDYQTGKDDNPHAHINFAVFGERISFLKKAYQTVIANIREEPEFTQLPIFVHGYDYVFPYPWGENDPRNPSYAAKNEWLGEPFEKRGYPEIPLRREIIKVLIGSIPFRQK